MGRLTTVGHVKDVRGLRGEIFLYVLGGEVSWSAGLEFLFFHREGESDPTQFTIKSCRAHKAGLLVTLEGILDRTQAEKWLGASLLIPSELLVAKAGERPYLGELLGFVVDKVGRGPVGEITGFSSNGAQDLLCVKDAGGTEHLIPFIKEFVLEMDFGSKRLLMDLPYGLLGEEESP